jgi:hypothetical protein
MPVPFARQLKHLAVKTLQIPTQFARGVLGSRAGAPFWGTPSCLPQRRSALAAVLEGKREAARCVWFDDPHENYVVCDCGWRPDLGAHYQVRTHYEERK